MIRRVFSRGDRVTVPALSAPGAKAEAGRVLFSHERLTRVRLDGGAIREFPTNEVRQEESA